MRGAVLIETALTVGIGLTILLFAVQVGALGFLQVTADAASYTAARAYAVGALPSTSPAAFVHSVFPQIAVADIATPSPSPAPSAPLAIDYEYNTGYLTNGHRHSGESMLQPLQIPTTVNPHGKVSLLGRLLSVGAEDVEAQWTECTPHFNAAQAAYQQCGLVGMNGIGGNPPGYYVNYFTGGENTPPYYVGFNFMEQCPKSMPWTSCSATTPKYLSLGIGSFLDTYNWGVAGANAYWSGNGGPGVPPTQTFEYMDCHFNRFADLAFFFQHYPDLPVLYSGSPSEAVGGWGGTIDTWLQTKQPTSFTQNITSFYNPSVDPGVDNDITQIYGWDVTLPSGTAINATEPGTNAADVPDPGYEC